MSAANLESMQYLGEIQIHCLYTMCHSEVAVQPRNSVAQQECIEKIGRLLRQMFVTDSQD